MKYLRPLSLTSGIWLTKRIIKNEMKTKLTNCVKTVLLSFMLGVLFACCQGAASSGNAGKNASRVRIASNDSAKLVPDKALNDASCVLAGLPVDKASGKLYALTRTKEWKNMECFPADGSPAGSFLTDGTGRHQYSLPYSVLSFWRS